MVDGLSDLVLGVLVRDDFVGIASVGEVQCDDCEAGWLAWSGSCWVT